MQPVKISLHAYLLPLNIHNMSRFATETKLDENTGCEEKCKEVSRLGWQVDQAWIYVVIHYRQKYKKAKYYLKGTRLWNDVQRGLGVLAYQSLQANKLAKQAVSR